MIEFCGEVSSKCKRWLLKQNALIAFLGALIPIIFVTICLVILYMTIEAVELWMFLLCEAFLLLILILAFFSPYIYCKKTFANMLPKIIRISKEGILDVEFEAFRMQKTIEDIKYIKDYGDWYYIVFRFPKKANLICQKSLIVVGEINDFKNLFSKKLCKVI